MRHVVSVIAVFGTAVLIGLCVVSFPASSVHLMAVLDLSKATYGTIFLPQLVTTIGGAVLGAIAARRWNMRTMLIVALGCFLAAEAALCASVGLRPAPALALLMFGTGIFGFGFGFGGGPINAMAARLFPQRANAAILTLHGLAGVGFTCAPFLFGTLIEAGSWSSGPVLLMLALSALLLCAAVSTDPTAESQNVTENSLRHDLSAASFKTAALVVFIYALAEGCLGNWILPFLETERGFNPQDAAIALSAFWGALTAGRLLAAILAADVAPRRLMIVLATLLAIALIAMLAPSSLAAFVVVFAVAGLGCSAFFPLLVALASEGRPEAVSLYASVLTGIMMAGTGVGAFGVGLLGQRLPLQFVFAGSAVLPLAILAILIGRTRARS